MGRAAMPLAVGGIVVVEVAVTGLRFVVVDEGDMVEEVEEVRQAVGAEGVNFNMGHGIARLCAPGLAGGYTFIVGVRLVLCVY